MQDVAVVIPVYNEAACISEVIDDWLHVLGGLRLDCRLLVLNDGSTDNTAVALARYGHDPRVAVIHKPNSGHGPTILEGYRLAVQGAAWVFQVDSDNEMAAHSFEKLWARRGQCDAVIGIRTGVRQPLARKLVSLMSRVIVRVLYGAGVADVNCPFRLMKSSVLREILHGIPSDTFAPNVVICGRLLRGQHAVLNVPVPHTGRRTGEVSIKKWKLLQAALRSFWQTVALRFR